MACCFMKATCFLKNINMAPSLHFMVRGTGRRNRKKVFLWHLFPLKMESQVVIGKCLQMILQEASNICRLMRQNIVHVVWHKGLMALCMYPMIKVDLFTKLFIKENKC